MSTIQAPATANVVQRNKDLAETRVSSQANEILNEQKSGTHSTVPTTAGGHTVRTANTNAVRRKSPNMKVG